MTTNQTPSAKEQVLQFVREKNPQTMELKVGCRIILKEEDVHYFWGGERMIYACSIDSGEISDVFCYDWRKYKISEIKEIIGSDMGLQELMIALDNEEYKVRADGWIVRGDGYGDYTSYALFDLTKNLHHQPDKFFTSLLPLING